MRFRSMLLSLAGFALLALGVAWLDPRVRDKFAQLLHAGDGLASVDNRALDFATAVVSAIRYQSIDNGVVMVFAAVGAVLFLFMVRT
jgi:hypothetical protein